MVLQVGVEADPATRIRLRYGKRIREFRQMRHLTQAQLGAKLDPPVTGAAVGYWETGKFAPRDHIQAQIAKALDTTWSALFALDGEAA